MILKAAFLIIDTIHNLFYALKIIFISRQWTIVGLLKKTAFSTGKILTNCSEVEIGTFSSGVEGKKISVLLSVEAERKKTIFYVNLHNMCTRRIQFSIIGMSLIR